MLFYIVQGMVGNIKFGITIRTLEQRHKFIKKAKHHAVWLALALSDAPKVELRIKQTLGVRCEWISADELPVVLDTLESLVEPRHHAAIAEVRSSYAQILYQARLLSKWRDQWRHVDLHGDLGAFLRRNPYFEDSMRRKNDV